MTKIKKFLIENYVIFLILIFGAFLLSINVNKPFIGHHDFNSAFFSNIARNLIRYDIKNTKLGLVLDSGPQSPYHFNYYTHNVPLHPWFLALSFRLLGQGEFQARVISIIFSLGALFFVYKITQKLFSASTAILAGLFFTTSSMFIYFGSNVFPEPQTICFSLGSFYFFSCWLEKRGKWDLYLMLMLTVLSLLTVWGAYFLVPFLALYYFLFESKKGIKTIIFFTILPFIIFSLYLGYLFLITNGSGFVSGLKTAFLFRLDNLDGGGGNNIPFRSFFAEEMHRALAYYSKTTIALVLGWALLLVMDIAKKRYVKRDFLLLSLLFWGLSYPLVFHQAAFIHDYFLIYLSPFIAIAAAVFIAKFLRLLRIKSGTAKLLVVFILFSFPLFQFLQTKNFTSALLATSENKQGMELGFWLAQNTNFQDKILVLSGQFGAFFGVFTNYYGDRVIIYSDYSLSDFKKEQVDNKYDYIVYIEGRDTLPDVKSYLAGKYAYTQDNIFTIFKTKQ